MSDIAKLAQCSVCLDEVITPYSLPCSHNFCGLCFHGLRTKTCPTCRYEFGKKKGTQVNTLLESLLRQHVVDYDHKKAEQAKCLEALELVYKYKKSQRMHDQHKVFKQYLKDNGMSCRKKDLIAHMTDAGVPEIELDFIIDSSDHTMILDINDEAYVCVVHDSEDLGSVLLSHKGNISHEQAMRLSILIEPDDHPFLALNLTGKHPMESSAEFIQYIKGLDPGKLIAKKKTENNWYDDDDSDWSSIIDRDSESESESETQADASASAPAAIPAPVSSEPTEPRQRRFAVSNIALPWRRWRRRSIRENSETVV